MPPGSPLGPYRWRCVRYRLRTQCDKGHTRSRTARRAYRLHRRRARVGQGRGVGCREHNPAATPKNPVVVRPRLGVCSPGLADQALDLVTRREAAITWGKPLWLDDANEDTGERQPNEQLPPARPAAVWTAVRCSAAASHQEEASVEALVGWAIVVVVAIGAIASSTADEPATTANEPAPGSTSASEPSGSSASAEASPTTEEAAEETPGLNTPVRDGKFEFTVSNVECGVPTIGEAPISQDAQGQYCLISLTVTNIGDEAQIFSDSSQLAFDAGGREFSADSAAAIYLPDSNGFLNQINPGNSVAGTIVFDVPPDAQLVSLELHDSPFSGGVTVKLA